MIEAYEEDTEEGRGDLQAEAIPKKEPREDLNQAAARIIREATERD